MHFKNFDNFMSNDIIQMVKLIKEVRNDITTT